MIKIIKPAKSAAGVPLNLAGKKKSTASGVERRDRKSIPRANDEAQMRAADMALQLAAKGVVGPTSESAEESMLEQYILLENIGAPVDVIAKVLNVTTNKVSYLRARAIDRYVSNLSESGVMGTLGIAFHRIEVASKKALAQLATLNDGDPRMMDTAKAVVAFEATKIDLLVRTGAIKVKRKIEVSSVMDRGTQGDPSLFSGADALRLLTMLTIEDEGDGTYYPAVQE